MNKLRKNSVGFTLIEVLIYITILIIVLSTVFSVYLWLTYSSIKLKIMRETLDNANRSMEIMVQETKEAKSIYSPTSSSSQLSLETTKHLPEDEIITYVDFYRGEDGKLFFKKEPENWQETYSGVNIIPLISDNFEVTNLHFLYSDFTEGLIPTVQIELTIKYRNLTGKSEYDYSVSLNSTVSLRSYAEGLVAP